ncbi:type IV toxin-antitoxin system AbiEi family antitoxin domain-containing protein [Tenggerimyces flavus]|uniref:DUF559 domain-containing protein n=1 Tax=Tenggerimyces flavus TaxID=1708749 RepID=A0ABV7YAY0_9ACTN|nr:type IV toxin-antitoxin system AbiEi family antitoxin domain-containing protein [Tenggerimyces flavus]MBM7786964.1 very-short-patch-repair endonuclease [Tenggerimyces flavus]
MNPLHSTLEAIAAHQHGLFTRQQALAAGYDDAHVDRCVRELAWHRIRPDVFVERAVWTSADAVQRHLLMVRAVLLRLDAPAVVSHWSAAAAWGFALHQPNLARVHVTRTDLETSQLTVGLHEHAGQLTPGEFTLQDELPITSAARTVIDVARVGPYESAVVAADSAIRLGVLRAWLVHALDAVRDQSGSGAAGRVIAFADGRSESAGESLARVVFAELDLPAPALQAAVSLDEHDRCDFYFREHLTVAEFDGRSPYHRGLRDGEDPDIVVRRERRREAELLDLGYQVVRVTWSDLYPANRHALGERVQQAFDRASRKEAVA